MGDAAAQSDDYTAGIVYANAITRAAIEFLHSTGGVNADDDIRMPVRRPLALFRMRVRDAYKQRTGKEWWA